MPIKWTASQPELEIIGRIAKRAAVLAAQLGHEITKSEVMMDIEATHCNGCALMLDDLVAARDADFSHDVFGIRRHLDRSTGQLGDCFTPRYAKANDPRTERGE